ncbi:MAG: hypothetical protein WAV60_17950, partial [Anaerolineae bacterium]
ASEFMLLFPVTLGSPFDEDKRGDDMPTRCSGTGCGAAARLCALVKFAGWTFTTNDVSMSSHNDNSNYRLMQILKVILKAL